MISVPDSLSEHFISKLPGDVPDLCFTHYTVHYVYYSVCLLDGLSIFKITIQIEISLVVLSKQYCTVILYSMVCPYVVNSGY